MSARSARDVWDDYRRESEREHATGRTTETARNLLVVELMAAGIPNLAAALHAWHNATTGRPDFPTDTPDLCRMRVLRLLGELHHRGRMPLTHERSTAA